MYRFHASLRDDYEVSCRELDLLVHLASSVRVSTALHDRRRICGCTINLVKTDVGRDIQSSYC